MIARQNDLINNNMKIMNNHILKQNILNINKNMKETDLYKNKKLNNRYKKNIKDRYFTNKNSFSKHYKNELNQLIDNILVMNKSFEKLEINYSIYDKSLEIQNLKSKINNVRKNSDVIVKDENIFKFISFDISSNKEYNNIQNIKI